MSRGRWAALTAAVVATAVAIGGVLVLTDTPPEIAEPPAGTPSPTTPSPSAEATETLDEQIERVAGVVADIRELAFDEQPSPTIVSPSELADRVGEQVSTYTTEEADLDGRLLVLLGALPPESDLRELLVAAYSEQVAGYYDSESGELVVGSGEQEERLSALNEVILAHELQHALADQALGLPELEDLGEGREDEVLARQALVEGDATVTMQQYMQVGLSVVDQLMIAREAAEMQAGLADLTELPPYLQGSIEFPYTYGGEFVAALLADGGWPAVDAAYASPPATTAEILFPQRYLAGWSARAPPSTGEPGGSWERARSYAFGAADLLLLLAAPGGDPDRAVDDPRAAAESWEGGEVILWIDGQRSAAAISLAGQDLCGPVETWYAASFPDASRSTSGERVVLAGDRQTAVLRCDGTGVRLGIAPDQTVATSLVSG